MLEEKQKRLAAANAEFEKKIDEIQRGLAAINFKEAAQVPIDNGWYLSYEYNERRWSLMVRNHQFPWLKKKKNSNQQRQARAKTLLLKKCNFEVKVAAIDKMANLFAALEKASEKAAVKTEEATLKAQAILDKGVAAYFKPPETEDVKDFKDAFNSKNRVEVKEEEEKTPAKIELPVDFSATEIKVAGELAEGIKEAVEEAAEVPGISDDEKTASVEPSEEEKTTAEAINEALA